MEYRIMKQEINEIRLYILNRKPDFSFNGFQIVAHDNLIDIMNLSVGSIHNKINRRSGIAFKSQLLSGISLTKAIDRRFRKQHKRITR